ncbi:hypothetical protein ATY81_25295 [Rhizobium sp. R72]|nr:hypothetical protein ATY81_25295 [Rhizobium sp. R72]OWW00504.1 hypothetical protein ATY80_25295 [Rhizobium sp. R711]
MVCQPHLTQAQLSMLVEGIDWRTSAAARYRGYDERRRRQVRLPLPQHVGDALRLRIIIVAA